jgi:GH25 family lysozyme M1 (1,4-beta-N-acetylmuramidase)
MSMTYGVDVSHHNGTVNWLNLKNTGKVQFAVIRVCHGTTIDRKFTANLTDCKAQNIPYAFYWYGEAATKSGAQAEAKFILSKIAGTNPLFVAYDAECEAISKLGKYDTTDVVWAACEIVKNAGYRPFVYCNENWRRNEIDIQYLKNKDVGFWYARYSKQTPEQISYASMCDMWQYSEMGKLSGNGSQYIDLDVCYSSELNNLITGSAVVPEYCDTTDPFTKRLGGTYTFKTDFPITCGNGSIWKQVSQTQSEGYYFTKFKAVGRGSAGFYINKKRICVGTVI